MNHQIYTSLLLLLLSWGLLWRKADSAKITCKTCKQFVVSFDERLEATASSGYAGGDTSWEEEKLGSYADSEVRLVEILDMVCSKSNYDCHRLLEEAEEDIERWWFKLRKQTGLQSWLCFQHLDVCCPEHTFGPSCQLCPGAPNDTCGGRGKCEGAEEKDGSGTCTCDRGYGGDMCQSCDTLFYPEEEEEEEEEEGEEGERDVKPTELRCKECDRACSKSCDGPGPGECQECADGYRESDEGLCEDIDECKLDGDVRCREGTYCSNTPGSFKCRDCDKACKKACQGPGAHKCMECALGYSLQNGICKDDDECADGSADCSQGTYCDNNPGKYSCKACHISCLSECHGPGSKGCVACKEGYSMSAEEGCEDIDECDSEPCNADTEVCSNLQGTFVCKCREDLVKGEEGKCVTPQERDRQREAKKERKRRKKKKKEGNEEGRRVIYPWYYTLGPLILSYLVYKYWKPNLVTSVVTILFVAAAKAKLSEAEGEGKTEREKAEEGELKEEVGGEGKTEEKIEMEAGRVEEGGKGEVEEGGKGKVEEGGSEDTTGHHESGTFENESARESVRRGGASDEQVPGVQVGRGGQEAGEPAATLADSLETPHQEL